MRLSAAQLRACGPNCRAAASAMCSGDRSGSSRAGPRAPAAARDVRRRPRAEGTPPIISVHTMLGLRLPCARRRGGQPLRRDAGRRPRRPAADAVALIDEGPQRRVHRYLPAGDAAGAVAAGAARAAAGRAGDVLRPAPRLLARRAPPAARAGDLRRRLRHGPLRRPLARARALDRRRRPGRGAAPSRTTPAGRCSSSAGASAGSSPRSRSAPTRGCRSLDRARREPVRLPPGAALAPLRPIDAVTRGQLVTQLYRVLGGAPAPLVQARLPARRDRQVRDEAVDDPQPPDDRELLAQIEAVDAFMGDMHAYPGRSFGQLYHRFFRTNDLADGPARARRPRVLDLAGVRVPVLAIAGQGDGIAPVAACHHVGDLLPQRAVGAARDGARRAPRRADRARGADDDLAAARRVPRRPAGATARAAPCGRLNAFVQRHRRAAGAATLTSPCAAPSPSCS